MRVMRKRDTLTLPSFSQAHVLNTGSPASRPALGHCGPLGWEMGLTEYVSGDKTLRVIAQPHFWPTLSASSTNKM